MRAYREDVERSGYTAQSTFALLREKRIYETAVAAGYLAAEARAPSRTALPAPSFYEESGGDWKRFVERIGSAGTTWTTVDDVVGVLQAIGAHAPLNHMHMPRAGGQDLTNATRSAEPGCIDIDCAGSIYIVRPKRLVLVMPQRDPKREWAYFWLDAAELAPSGIYEEVRGDREEVLEVAPGEYVDFGHWSENSLGEDEDGHDIPLPVGSRPVTRQFRGAFLIVTKGAGYNQLTIYDGRHSRMGFERHRTRIQEMVDEEHAAGRYGEDLG
ncbi:MAG: hypothetical protein J0L92_03750 [Deltaproteobacteria bacterium]|nr:hypothetical protein [Deltaproteobacteria bacterium]